MTVVGRLEGLIQPDDLINQLTFIMDANQTYLVSERLEREERNQTQVLRQQQDEAYLASLRADQEKEEEKGGERAEAPEGGGGAAAEAGGGAKAAELTGGEGEEAGVPAP